MGMGLASDDSVLKLAPPTKGAAVAPSDSADLPNVCRFLYIGVLGDVTAKLSGDSVALLYKAVPAGTYLRGEFVRVMATGTTATNILALR